MKKSIIRGFTPTNEKQSESLLAFSSNTVGAKAQRGFTLIEVLLVIAILAILAAIVIIALNPAKQLAESQNAQRRSDVRAILDAVHQYSIDNQGAVPDTIPTGGANETCISSGSMICQFGAACGAVSLDALAENENYIVQIPADPATATDVDTNYFIFKSLNGRISVCAPDSYGENPISVTR